MLSSKQFLLILSVIAAAGAAQADVEPDPPGLPIAGSQVPDTNAYAQLIGTCRTAANGYQDLPCATAGVSAIQAGGYYLDPTTNVKMYKLTDSTTGGGMPLGHDYMEGGDEVSLPLDSSGKRTIHVTGTGGTFWLLDFAPNPAPGQPRVNNVRQLTGNFRPNFDGGFTFSNNSDTPYYAYVANGTTIRRFNFVTMVEAPQGGKWPVNNQSPLPTWLHQSINDSMFTWMLGLRSQGAGRIFMVYKPHLGHACPQPGPTCGLRSYHDVEDDLNEPRIDRGGRYVGISLNSQSNSNVTRIWDWEANDGAGGVLPDNEDPEAEHAVFAHQASVIGGWLGFNWNKPDPGRFAKWRAVDSFVPVTLDGAAVGNLEHASGNWLQPTADFDDQWALAYHYEALQPPPSQHPPNEFLAPGGMVLFNASGGRRLLGHMYNTSTVYSFFSFCKFSSDGFYVLFTSNMNPPNPGTGRSDVFLAEMPTIVVTPTPTPTPPPSSGCGTMVDVVWTNKVNVTATGNDLLKTSGCDGCADAGATSQQQVASGDACLEVTGSETNNGRVFGLSSGNADTSYTEIDFGIYFTTGGDAEVRESGAYQASTTNTTGAIFKVAVESGQVKYYKNGSAFHTSAASPTYPLLVDTSLFSLNSTIDNARVTVSGPVGPQDVIWTNKVNVTATVNSLEKTSGCSGCDDAGATSQQQITAGTGYVEVTGSETTKARLFGLSNGNAGTGYADIDFAIYFTTGGSAEVRENGVYKGGTTNTTGAVFKVGVVSGVVTYYKNGTAFYTSQATATYPLIVDTSLFDLSSTISNAKILVN